MGGEVSETVHVAAGEGTCEFMGGSQGGRPGAIPGGGLQMRIAVSHLPQKECVTGERLIGVGQDAVLCRTDVQGVHREIIDGRVRTRYFLLVLMLTRKEMSAIEEASWRRSLEQAAEEVAGSLF